MGVVAHADDDVAGDRRCSVIHDRKKGIWPVVIHCDKCSTPAQTSKGVALMFLDAQHARETVRDVFEWTSVEVVFDNNGTHAGGTVDICAECTRVQHYRNQTIELRRVLEATEALAFSAKGGAS